MEVQKMMSDERGKEKEVSIDIHHFCHEHPFTLSVAGKERSGICYGCRRLIYPAEMAYTCRDGCRFPRLHQECAEMPQQIKLPMHPQHTLIQKEVYHSVNMCAICDSRIIWIGYYCSNLQRCKFQVHVGCAQNFVDATPSCIVDHPSHPHQLNSLGRSSLSRCDACGTVEKGNFYLCIACRYCIHESCAFLPATADFHHHHHHPLSLVYHLPLEYIRYGFRCEICLKDFLPRYWAYHCATCRYAVHIKCAISSTTMNIAAEENKDAIVFPTKTAEELIRSFVGGAMPNPNEMQVVNGKYKFHCHDHDLHLISSSINNQQQQQEEDNYDSGLSRHGELVCDGCTTPILPNNQDKYYYMSCGECKYFLHWACFHLPPQLPSHPLHPKPNHTLTLQPSPKVFNFPYCGICRLFSNGLIYSCTKCNFKADIKCTSLPSTLIHKAHPRHLLSKWTTSRRPCIACGEKYDESYGCDICDVRLDRRCALLPAVVSNPEWDKHPLPLMHDASLDHPSDFYCDICEQKMNPKLWMYHCRTCDFSLHPRCFPAASGRYRNIKFGQRYLVASVHHHPLRHQLLTTNLNCSVCGRRQDYGSRGFQCTSHNCEFFMCSFPCSRIRKAVMQAVD